MRIVLQRVKEASVHIQGAKHCKINAGLLVLLGITEVDTQEDVAWLANKIVTMRIFSDTGGKMNFSLLDIGGDLLVVSQFTLMAETKKGNRPSYTKAAKPELAMPLYSQFCALCSQLLGKEVLTGVFGADMQVMLINDGPVTIMLDSKSRE